MGYKICIGVQNHDRDTTLPQYFQRYIHPLRRDYASCMSNQDEIEIPLIDITNLSHFLNRGKHAFIYRDEEILGQICERYGRDIEECVLKVFYGNPISPDETIYDARWGDDLDTNSSEKVRKNTMLVEGTKIQNLCWLEGLSARVYGVFVGRYDGKRVGIQLTEYLIQEGKKSQQRLDELHHRLNLAGEKYGFSEVKNMISFDDKIAGKIVDLQQYAFTKDAQEKIRDIYAQYTRYGKIYYQDIPELDLYDGPRKSTQRVDDLWLDSLDFEGKIVWDIGCAGGYFVRYALDHGAKRVIGFDEPNIAWAAAVVSQYLGYFNADFVGLDLKQGIPKEYLKPDIVFYLSMNLHIEPPDRLFEADKLVFEDNGKESRAWSKPEDKYTKEYTNVAFVGRARDHGDKAIYHLWR